MNHECEQKEAILKVFNVLDEIKEKLSDFNKEQALTNQLLKGNGVKGLCDRVTDLEANYGILSKAQTENKATAKLIKAQLLALGAVFGFLVSTTISLIEVLK